MTEATPEANSVCDSAGVDPVAGAALRDSNPISSQETPVEIHPPKPVHSWREFLGEYAIVVLGVLTALAAEQSVEWLHWQSEVAAARKSITAEIQGNNQRMFARRIAIASCMERQADEAERVIDDLEAGRKPGAFTGFQSITGSLVSESEWQSERAAQTLVHFPRDELALLGRYYGQMQIFTLWMERESDDWQVLSVLAHPPQTMGAADLLRLRAALHSARRYERLIVLNSERQLATSRSLGLPKPSIDPQLVQKFCTSNDQEYLDSIRAQEHL